jgi:hypothetical protein
MDNLNRNTRTLIVSFVIAIFALIPLRFIEVGGQQSMLDTPQVLGETISVVPTKSVEIKLEAPYNEIENCISRKEVNLAEKEVIKKLEEGSLDEEQRMMILDKLREVEINVCKD